MRSYKLYCACITVALTSFVALLLSWRYRVAFDGYSKSKHVMPACLLKLHDSNYSDIISSRYCTLAEVKKLIESRQLSQISSSQICVGIFFRDCISGPKEVLIKNGDYYELNGGQADDADMRAIGHMLAIAYHQGHFLDINIDEKLLKMTFTSLVKLANDLMQFERTKLASTFDNDCYSNMDNVKYVTRSGKFELAGYEDFGNTRCCFSNILANRLRPHFPEYISLIEGRQKYILDGQLVPYESKPELFENIKARISETEPLRLRNWWRYGFESNSIQFTQGKEIFKCLKSLSSDKLQKLYTKSTGFQNMPLGGAVRLQRITFLINYSGDYRIEPGHWTLKENFDCQEFKRKFDL